MHAPHIEPLQPVLGFLTAGISTLGMWIANNVPNTIPTGMIEFGGTVGLIGGLTYGCITLWKSLQQQRVEFTQERAAFIKAKDELEKEIREDWKEQNDKLIAVLHRLEKAEK